MAAKPEQLSIEPRQKKSGSASMKEQPKPKTQEKMMINPASSDTRITDVHQAESYGASCNPKDTSLDQTLMTEESEMNQDNVGFRFTEQVPKNFNFPSASKIIPQGSTNNSQNTPNHLVEDGEIDQSQTSFLRYQENTVMDQEIEQEQEYFEGELPNDQFNQNNEMPDYCLQEEMEQQQYLSQPVIFESQEPQNYSDFYPNEYNTIQLNLSDHYPQADGQQPVFLQIPVIPNSQQVISVTSNQQGIVIQMLPNNYRRIPEVEVVRHHILPQNNYGSYQYIPNPTIKFQQPALPTKSWSYPQGYTQQPISHQYSHVLPQQPRGIVANRAQRIRMDENYSSQVQVQQPLPAYNAQYSQEYVQTQSVYYPNSEPVSYSLPMQTIQNTYSQNDQRFVPNFSKTQ